MKRLNFLLLNSKLGVLKCQLLLLMLLLLLGGFFFEGFFDEVLVVINFVGVLDYFTYCFSLRIW